MPKAGDDEILAALNQGLADGTLRIESRWVRLPDGRMVIESTSIVRTDPRAAHAADPRAAHGEKDPRQGGPQ